jgi:hypothetical protein
MPNASSTSTTKILSKSKGNFITVRDIGREYDLEACASYALGALRSPVNFGREMIAQAQSRRTPLRRARPAPVLKAALRPCAGRKRAGFMAAADEAPKSSTPPWTTTEHGRSLGALFELAREVSGFPRGRQPRGRRLRRVQMLAMTDVLGLLSKQPDG